jgi:hypothetical protein
VHECKINYNTPITKHVSFKINFQQFNNSNVHVGLFDVANSIVTSYIMSIFVPNSIVTSSITSIFVANSIVTSSIASIFVANSIVTSTITSILRYLLLTREASESTGVRILSLTTLSPVLHATFDVLQWTSKISLKNLQLSSSKGCEVLSLIIKSFPYTSQ